VKTDDVGNALARLSEAKTVSDLLNGACEDLTVRLDATGCSVSRTIGDLLVELGQFMRLGDPLPLALYLVSDYPLTREVLEQGEPRVVSRDDPEADPAEAELLERLGFQSLLMLPLRARRDTWGLVEVYRDGGGAFVANEIEAASALVEGVGELLANLETGPPRQG
jgi:GAF domain-containing protein